LISPSNRPLFPPPPVSLSPTSTSSSFSLFQSTLFFSLPSGEKSIQNKVSSVRKATRSVGGLSVACFAAHHPILLSPYFLSSPCFVFRSLSFSLTRRTYWLFAHQSIELFDCLTARFSERRRKVPVYLWRSFWISRSTGIKTEKKRKKLILAIFTLYLACVPV